MYVTRTKFQSTEVKLDASGICACLHLINPIHCWLDVSKYI